MRPVHGDVGKIGQQPRSAVRRRSAGNQLRMLVDERRRHPTGAEVGIVQHGLQERDVRPDTPNAELRQSAASTRHSGVEVEAPAGQLHQQ
nr:hypothetical protein [Jiangella gansuensis]